MGRDPDQDTFDRFTEGRRERGRFGENEQRDADRVVKSDLVDLTLFLRNDNPTKKAIGVSEKGDAPFEQWKWLPRSLVEYEVIRKGVTIVTMPERLAHEKGLI